MTITVGGGRPATKVTAPKTKTPQAAPPKSDDPKAGPSTTILAGRWVVWFVIRNRWRLAPLLLFPLAAFAATDRASNGLQLAVIAVGVLALSHPWRPAGHAKVLAGRVKARSKGRGDRCHRGARHFGADRPQHVLPLTLHERRAAGLGLVAVVVWLGITATPMPGWLSAGVLLALVGYPSWLWLRSPWRGKPKPLDPRTVLILNAWAEVVAVRGPVALQGSKVMLDTLTEVPGGGLGFTVRLDGHHPSNAVADEIRKEIETVLSPPPISMPMDSVTLVAVKDDGGADRIRVTMSPTRHLQAQPIVWPGPVIRDGLVPMGEDVGGAVVSTPIWDGSGCKPFVSSGATNQGKSNTTAVAVAPSVLDETIQEVVIYVDGGRGSSSSAMNKMATMKAITPEEWDTALQVAHAICVDRQKTMGEQNLDEWNAKTSPWHSIILVISEPNTVKNALTKARNDEFQSLSQICRKTGVRWAQEPQNTRDDQMLGGVVARNQVAANGSLFIHYPGGSSAASSATDGLDVPGIAATVNGLDAIPGMAVVVSEKKIISKVARIYNCKKELNQLLDDKLNAGWRPPTFSDRELEIAAAFGWTSEGGFGEPPEGEAQEFMTAPAASKTMESKQKIYAALRQHPAGLTVQQITEVTDLSRATVDRHRAEMADVVPVGGGIYQLAEFALADIQDEGEAA